MKKKLERKRFRVKDDKGNYIGSLDAVSIVKRPAIESGFGLFAEDVETKKIKFQVSDAEKMEITGPIMMAGKDILRYDYENECYYFCYFTEEDLIDYRDYFMRYSNTRQSNLDHSNDYLDDFFLAEIWTVTDENSDKAKALGFTDVHTGDLWATFKCTNKETWEMLKESDFSGFSVELQLDYFSDLKLEEQINVILDNKNLTREQKLEQIKEIVYK